MTDLDPCHLDVHVGCHDARVRLVELHEDITYSTELLTL